MYDNRYLLAVSQNESGHVYYTGKILQPFKSLSTSVNVLSKLTTFGIHDVRYR